MPNRLDLVLILIFQRLCPDHVPSGHMIFANCRDRAGLSPRLVDPWRTCRCPGCPTHQVRKRISNRLLRLVTHLSAGDDACSPSSLSSSSFFFFLSPPFYRICVVDQLLPLARVEAALLVQRVLTLRYCHALLVSFPLLGKKKRGKVIVAKRVVNEVYHSLRSYDLRCTERIDVIDSFCSTVLKEQSDLAGK